MSNNSQHNSGGKKQPSNNGGNTNNSTQNNMMLDSNNVFVKYLPANLKDSELHDLFSKHGEIISSKIMIDQVTSKSLGYGFVRFKSSEEAQIAINCLNGQKIHNKRLLCKLANQSPASSLSNNVAQTSPILSNQTPSNNLYIKPLLITTGEDELRELFAKYGVIKECKVMVDRNTGVSRQIGFVRFERDEDASKAIAGMHGQRLEPNSPPLNVKYADTETQKEARRFIRTQHNNNNQKPNSNQVNTPQPLSFPTNAAWGSPPTHPMNWWMNFQQPSSPVPGATSYVWGMSANGYPVVIPVAHASIPTVPPQGDASNPDENGAPSQPQATVIPPLYNPAIFNAYPGGYHSGDEYSPRDSYNSPRDSGLGRSPTEYPYHFAQLENRLQAMVLVDNPQYQNGGISPNSSYSPSYVHMVADAGVFSPHTSQSTPMTPTASGSPTSGGEKQHIDADHLNHHSSDTNGTSSQQPTNEESIRTSSSQKQFSN